MPTICKLKCQLAPDTGDINTQDSQFLYIRNVCRRQKEGNVVSPTKTEFMREWNSHVYPADYSLTCSGDTFIECKESLRNISFPACVRRITLNANIWVKMIMAFNMYAMVRSEFNLSTPLFVDFICPVGNNNQNRSNFKKYFNGRNVLFIANNKIRAISDSLENERFSYFWDLIFITYDYAIFCYLQETNNLENFTDRNEYFSFENDNNQQIANMIRHSKNSIPSDIRKQIYEICIAFHISHSE